jgi:ring-1,2-phenylacetyl-CoA epoxidase subunit PaaD
VPDPELPMLTLADLGIVRDVTADGDRVVVSVTPTYSGCPALAEIRADLSRRLAAAGVGRVEVRTVLNPPWSSDWITDAGRRKLAAAGIAPPGTAPQRPATGPVPLTLTLPAPRVTCPACGSADTERTAAFSATACKDLHRCRACAEPFEHVKEI